VNTTTDSIAVALYADGWRVGSALYGGGWRGRPDLLAAMSAECQRHAVPFTTQRRTAVLDTLHALTPFTP
jgi:hypothetical protein